MLNKVFKWGGPALSFIGVLMMVVGLRETQPTGLVQSGTLFFIGGIIIHILISLGDRLRVMTLILSDLDRTLATQVPINEENYPLEKLDVTTVAPPELPRKTPFAPPFLMPEIGLPEKDETLVYSPPQSYRKEAVKTDYFTDIPSEVLPQNVSFKHENTDQKPDETPITTEEVVKQSNERLSQIARDFPELDAILRRDKSVEIPPSPVKEVLPPVSILREGVISDIPFKLFSDGTIEGDFTDGRHRFPGINEFRKYVEGS